MKEDLTSPSSGQAAFIFMIRHHKLPACHSWAALGTFDTMPVLKPYHRCVRPWPDGSYTSGGRSGYVRHPSYAKNPEYLIRAFMLLQEDLQRLFEYVEPADTNSSVYSYRCLELLIRACGEAEANFRAVLEANGDMREKKTMVQYKKLEKTHRLSFHHIA